MKLNKRDVAILIFLVIFSAVASTLIVAKSASGAWSSEKPILERYYSSGVYSYLVNPITDVVYIKYEECGHNYYWDFVPLYKPDGTIVTGVELKKAMEGEGIVIY